MFGIQNKTLGQLGILSIVMALCAGAVGLVIVDTIFGPAVYNFSGITKTIVPFVVVFFALGLMMLAGSIGSAFSR